MLDFGPIILVLAHTAAVLRFIDNSSSTKILWSTLVNNAVRMFNFHTRILFFYTAADGPNVDVYTKGCSLPIILLLLSTGLPAVLLVRRPRHNKQQTHLDHTASPCGHR